MTWSAELYTRFEQERTRPVRDLVAAIPTTTVHTAVDLGCGPGNSTEVLAQRFPGAQVIGLDNAPDMIRAARERLPALTFELADIGHWHPTERFDAILANASLQWLPDHATLYPGLVERLNEGGSLAVQTPDNLEEPAHQLARAVAANGPWRAKIAQVRHHERHTAGFYYSLLQPVCQQVDVWRTTYFHPLPGASAIVEWFRSTALRPFLAPLDEAERSAFVAEYQTEIERAYPALADGTVLLPFPRLFIVAVR